MDINIQRGEGISQAIKRQLKAEGIQESQFSGSIWSKIQQTLKADEESTLTHGGDTKAIGDLWTKLNMNVKTYVNDVVKISAGTWEAIKNLFGATPTPQPTPTPTPQPTPTPTPTPTPQPTPTPTPQPTPQPQQTPVNVNKLSGVLKSDPKATGEMKKAAEFLAELANMNPKPQVKSGRNEDKKFDWKEVRLPDGRWANVIKFDDGTIEVRISHDTTPDSDGKDYNDVCYRIKPNGEMEVSVDTDHSNTAWEKEDIPISGAGFGKELMNAVGQIFGDGLISAQERKDIAKKAEAKAAEKRTELADCKSLITGIRDDQEVIDQLQGANKLLAKVANMNPKPQVHSGRNEDEKYDWKQVYLPDGRWAKVVKYDDGYIGVCISHDTAPVSNGKDWSEVAYRIKPNGKMEVLVDTDRSNTEFEKRIEIKKDGYKDNLMAIVKKIFGDI